jgi:hypothetical protein
VTSTAVTAVGVFLVGAVAAFTVAGGYRQRGPAPCGGDGRETARASLVAPLELIALEHDRDGDRFIVRGIVRNPAAEAVDGLVASVSVFGRDGAMLTSARAAVAASKLASGAETPFVVVISGVDQVNRYHLSFRTAAGVVPHLDRRGRVASSGLA